MYELWSCLYNSAMNSKLKAFVLRQASSNYPSALWFEDDQYNIYVRAGKAASYGKQETLMAITIANITVQHDHQRHGVMRGLVRELKALGGELGFGELQIENAITPEMIAFCEKNDFIKSTARYSGPPCYFISLEKNHVS